MKQHYFLIPSVAVLFALTYIFLTPLLPFGQPIEAIDCISGFHHPQTGNNTNLCVADAGNKTYPAGGVYNPSADPQGKCVNNDGHYDATCMTQAYPPNGVAPQSGGSTTSPPSNTGSGSSSNPSNNPAPVPATAKTTTNCSVTYQWVRTKNGNDMLEVVWTYPANYYMDGQQLGVQSSSDNFDVAVGTRGITAPRGNVYDIPASAFKGNASSYTIQSPGTATDGSKQCQGTGAPLPSDPPLSDKNVPPPTYVPGVIDVNPCASTARPKECEAAKDDNHLDAYNDDICFSVYSLEDGQFIQNGQLLYPQYKDASGTPKYNTVDCKAKRGKAACDKKRSEGYVYTYVLGSDPETSCYSFTSVITVLMQYALLIASIICGFMFLWGGIKYTVSKGKPAALMEARDQILHATIGLVLVLTAYVIVLFLQGSLGFLGINLVGPFGSVFGT